MNLIKEIKIPIKIDKKIIELQLKKKLNHIPIQVNKSYRLIERSKLYNKQLDIFKLYTDFKLTCKLNFNPIFNKFVILFVYLLLLRFISFVYFKDFAFEDIIYKFNNENISNLLSSTFSFNFIKINLNSLGILPCLNSSFILQLLVTRFKYFEDLNKNGGIKGKIILEYWNKFIILGLSLLASIYYYYNSWLYIERSDNIIFYNFSFFLVSGTMINLLISDKINDLKIGSGLSIIILYNFLTNTGIIFNQNFYINDRYTSSAFIIGFIAVISVSFLLVLIQDSEKKIKIIKSNKYKQKTSFNYSTYNFIPIKLNPSGVISLIIIYATSYFASITVGNNSSSLEFGSKYYFFQLLFFILQVFLVFTLNYLFASQQFKFEEVTKNLNNQNCYVPGIRSGKNTTAGLSIYLRYTILCGSIALVLVYGMLGNIENLFNIKIVQGFSGNLILIITGITLDLTRRLFSEVSISNYNKLKF